MGTKRSTWQGHPCPTGGEAHGPLLAIRGVEGWYCPHASHNGLPKSAPNGPAPETQRVFTTDQVTAQVPV